MASRLSMCALVCVVVLANTVPSASASYAVTVTAGQWVTLSVPGVVRADAQPAEIAVALADADSVRIYGVRPGTATLTLTTPESVEARPIQVAPPPAPGSALFSRAGDCPVLAYRPDPARFAYDGPDLALDWTPAVWHLEWTPPDVRVLASNALTTPLQQLGVPAAPGLQAEWHDQWQLIAGDGLGLVGYHLAGAGTLVVGDSALGPSGFVDAAVGAARVSAVALKTPSGQFLTGAQAAVDVGPVNLGYATGPAGGSPSVQFHSGAVSASAGAIPGQGVQVGLGIALSPAVTIDSSWTSAGGWQVHVAVPVGDGASAAPGAASAGVPAASAGAGCLR